MASDKAIMDLITRCQYKYKDLTKRDIQAALSYFKELNVVLDKHVYPNGQSKDLVSLNGTIPVNFKSNRYNIPVQLYLADTHPYTPPICYVRPTPDMSINLSETVDGSGRINLPCLREWQYPQSDIYVLLNLMTMRFSEQTPLFSKVNRPAANPTPYQASSSQYQPPMSNPAASNPLPYPVNDMRPTYPSTGYGSYPTPANPIVNPYATPTAGISNPTPYPVSNNPYYPMPSTQPGPSLSYMKNGSGTNLGQVRPATSSQPPYPTSISSTPSSSSSYADDTIRPEHYKMSLVSAIQDKARLKFFEIESIKKAEIDSLKRINQDLQDGDDHLNSYINEAENEMSVLNNLTMELKRKSAQMSENINRMQHRDKASIDDAVVTTTPLYRQLLQLFAEEMAIQDLVFYLSEGLQHKTVTLEHFLKQIRFLSRKQFMLRATMQKAREKAALPI